MGGKPRAWVKAHTSEFSVPPKQRARAVLPSGRLGVVAVAWQSAGWLFFPPELASEAVLHSTPFSLYLLRIIYWVVHQYHALCCCPFYVYSHTHGLRLENLMSAPPVATLNTRMVASTFAPSTFAP